MAQQIQELLQTKIGTEGNLLIPTKIYDVLWEQVEKSLVGRQFAAFIVGPDGQQQKIVGAQPYSVFKQILDSMI